MGIETRWVCHTCKTIYDANGFRDYFCNAKPPSVREAKRLQQLLNFVQNFNDIHRLQDFLVQYISWREFHKGHKIAVTNDYGLDLCDIEYEYTRENDYHQKTVESYRSVDG